jgi:hypothetical protein
MQWVIDRFRKTNELVASKALPPPIDWSDNVCGRCRFLNVCMPDQVRTMGGLQIWELPGMVEKLRRIEALKSEIGPAKEELEELEKHVKGIFKKADGSQFAVEEFLVTKTEREVKGYEVKPRVDTVISIKKVGASTLGVAVGG